MTIGCQFPSCNNSTVGGNHTCSIHHGYSNTKRIGIKNIKKGDAVFWLDGRGSSTCVAVTEQDPEAAEAMRIFHFDCGATYTVFESWSAWNDFAFEANPKTLRGWTPPLGIVSEQGREKGGQG